MYVPLNYPGRGRTTFTCPVCSKQFERYNSKVFSEKPTCSRRCAWLLNHPIRSKTMIDFICNECGKSFKRRKGYGGTGDYCSRHCLAAARGRNMRGPNHPGWRGGTSARAHGIRNLIKRKIQCIGHCEECGSTADLQGHHILSHSEFPNLRSNPDNIQVLCAACHASKHPDIKNMITIPRKNSMQELTCITCGENFLVHKYKITTAKYCSKSCAIAGLRKSNTGRRTGKYMQCTVCGAERYINIFRIETFKYCSRKCHTRATSKKQKSFTT